MRRNRGWFRKGEDHRRHERTEAERRRGGKRAFAQLWTTHPRLARWLLEHRIKAPLDRAARNAERLAWAAERQRQEPDDIPYETTGDPYDYQRPTPPQTLPGPLAKDPLARRA